MPHPHDDQPMNNTSAPGSDVPAPQNTSHSATALPGTPETPVKKKRGRPRKTPLTGPPKAPRPKAPRPPVDSVTTVYETPDGQRLEEEVVRFGRRRRRITLTGEAATQDLLVLCEFPFATLNDRRSSKSALQQLNLIEHQWDTQTPRGKSVRAIWRVRGDEEYGLPNTLDERIYMVLMQLSFEQGYPARVRFSTYDLLKRLGWGDSGERYQDLIHAFRRLSGVRLFAQNVLRAVPGRPEMFTFGESGSSIIGHYHLRHEQLLAPPHRPLPGRLAQGPGFEAGAGFNEEGEVNMALFPDEPGASADCSHFSWSLPVQELLRAGQLRTLSLEFALSLKRPTALRLARYLGKKAFDGKEAFEIGLARLCGMHLGMTTTPHDSVMQQRLKAAHEELLARNFITKVEFSEMKSQDGQKVRYEFGPRAYAQADRPGAIENAPAPEEQTPLPFEGKVDASSTSSTSTDSPASSGKAEPGANADEELLAPLVARMEASGVSTGVARELLALVGASEVELQLACLDEREPRDRAATFVKATREMWSPPAAYRDRIEAKVRDEERRAASEEAERRRVAEREQEQREHDRQAHENAGLDALWDKLEEPTRAILEREAVERLGVLGRTGRAQVALTVMRRAVLRERLGQLHQGEE
jgi:hypothetical protein